MPSKCKFDKCKKQARYNLPGQSAKYCGDHAKENMIDIYAKHCKECGKRPSFGIPNESAQYCIFHKKENMINVNKKKCRECDKTASFGLSGQIAQYCTKHKRKDMINVTHKKCSKNNCKIIPIYGLPGQSAQYCTKHKKNDMIDVVNKRCIIKDCETIPTYSLQGQRAQYCAKHKKENMIDVVSRRCKSEFCNAFVRTNKYKGYCAYCFKNLFPDDPLSKNHKTKEKEVVNFIKQEFEDQHDITTDKIVGGCSKRRPDILIELYLKKYNIIIEIDEGAHRDYDTTCENKRTCELYQDLAYKKLIIIRFNPDSYVNEEGKRIRSPWTFSKTGVLSISNKKEWTSRLNALKEKISHWIETKPTKAITIDYLFFDEE